MQQITRLAVILLLCLCYTCSICSAGGEARWCTISAAEQQKCEDMKTAFTGKGLVPSISCVNEASTEACLQRIAGGTADLITLDGGDVHSGGERYDIRPIMEEIYADGKKGYNALAVVRKSNTDITIENLAGKRSCHTGYGRTAGWNIPVGFLLEEGLMPSVGCKESLASASQFFQESCVPGALAAAPDGVDVTNLCALCNDSAACSRSDDLYAGYTGALRCLVEQNADVAFIKTETVYDNTDGKNQDAWARNLTPDDFEILCRDGTRRAITEDATCHLAPSPSHAVVTSVSKPDDDISSYVALLESAVEFFGADDNGNGFTMFDSSKWSGADLLFKDTTERLGELEANNYVEFLGDEYIGSLDGLSTCPADSLRFCTISDGEQEKCLAMKTAFSGANLSPEISCYQESSHSDCNMEIAAGRADLVTLDGGDIYDAGKKYEMVPVMGEDYGTGDATYYAVAVVKSNTDFTINDLKGKKSCHTGIKKTSGWIVPIGYLVENNHVTAEECDGGAIALGGYFSQSCAPGALSDKYNPAGTNPKSLCDLCIGEQENFCARSDAEPYYDYSGAFRCLVEDAGEVAFVKHTTVGDNVNPTNPEEWNENLQASDYNFLCPDGSRQQDWTQDCSLGKVSSHALMTSKDKTNDDLMTIRKLFNDGQNLFSSDTGSGFKLFDSAGYEGSDLLFKDSTQTLQDVGNLNTYDKWLSEEYIKGLETVLCESGAASNKMAVFVLVAVLAIVHLLTGPA